MKDLSVETAWLGLSDAHMELKGYSWKLNEGDWYIRSRDQWGHFIGQAMMGLNDDAVDWVPFGTRIEKVRFNLL